MSKLLDKLLCELRNLDSSGGGFQGGAGPEPKPPNQPINPPKGGAPAGATSFSLITSTGGVQGLNSVLLVPFFNINTKKFNFAVYDPTNFNCEEDCIYNFKVEDVKAGRVVDIHKVYLQYRDIGVVTFTVLMTAAQLKRETNKETIVTAQSVIKVGNAKPDNKIHSYFVDLKIQGERPQLSIIRKANDGPLALIMAMPIGNVSEEQQL